MYDLKSAFAVFCLKMHVSKLVCLHTILSSGATLEIDIDLIIWNWTEAWFSSFLVMVNTGG